MSFVLKTADKEAVIWQDAFDTERRSEEQSALGIVATLSGIYNDEIDDAVESLLKILPSYEGCRDQSGDDSCAKCP